MEISGRNGLWVLASALVGNKAGKGQSVCRMWWGNVFSKWAPGAFLERVREREQPRDSLGGGAFPADRMAMQRPWGRPAPGISRHGQEGREVREEGDRGRGQGESEQ